MKKLLTTLLVSILSTLPIRCEDISNSESSSSIVEIESSSSEDYSDISSSNTDTSSVESSTEIENTTPSESTSIESSSSVESSISNENSSIESSTPNESSTEIESSTSSESSSVESSTEIESSTSTESSSTEESNSSDSNKEKEIENIELVNNTYYSIPSSYTLQLQVNYDDESYEFIDVSDDMINGNINYSVVGKYPINITYQNVTESFVIDVVESKKITLSSSDSIRGISQYSTGNYVSYTKNGENFQFYRANRSQSSSLTSILPKETYVNVSSLPGAIYNKSCIDGIIAMEIEYISIDGITLQVGKNKTDMNSIKLPSQNSYLTQTVTLDNVNFFSVETNNSSATIKSINIYYSNVSNGGVEEYIKGNEGKYRLNPVVYEGTLTPGVSYVDVPIDITVTGDSYTVNETKRYTYYTYDYVSQNPSVANEAAQIEPMDVANYFIAFKTYPANYVVKKSYSTAKSIFKEKTRCVSDYSRTNGYATSVPYRANSSGKPHYYECDIALSSSYSSSNRGTGRLVVWKYGFTSSGYDNSIVAVYTDDHYASFAEYLNNGRWGDYFNAEFNRTCYSYGSAITLN